MDAYFGDNRVILSLNGTFSRDFVLSAFSLAVWHTVSIFLLSTCCAFLEVVFEFE
jgi:hypothetical protein